MARKARACLETGLKIIATLLHFEQTEQGQTVQTELHGGQFDISQTKHSLSGTLQALFHSS